MRIRAFITHKLSESYSDCQDRFSINPDSQRIAVSDGMSQSIFPELWAELLAKQYTDKGTCNEDDRKELCQQWYAKVMDYLHSEQEKGNNPWRLENTIAEKNGAGATICGVNFKNATDWEGQVLGDSCILIINTQTGKVKPICTSEKKAFDSYPDYYESFAEKKGRGGIEPFHGRIDPEHVMLLVSDPFSEYAFKHQDDAKIFINRVLKLKTHEDYCQFVDAMRKNEGLHNDDSTLCIVEFDNSLDFNIEHQDDIEHLIKEEVAASESGQKQDEAPQESKQGESSSQQTEQTEKQEGVVICSIVQNGKEKPIEGVPQRNVAEEQEATRDLEAFYKRVMENFQGFCDNVLKESTSRQVRKIIKKHADSFSQALETLYRKALEK